jgi:hypothetical protein
LSAIDKLLEPIASGAKPLTLINIANAIDQVVSPKTHLIINLFEFFQGVMEGVIGTFMILYKVISWILTPFDWLASLFGANKVAAKLLGIALGILVANFIAITIWTTAAALADMLYNKTMLRTIWVNRAAIVSFIRLTIAEIASAVAIGGLADTVLGFVGILLGGLIPALIAATTAAIAFAIALFTNPITWIVLAVVALGYGLYILYIRWKAFRDIVNATTEYILKHWTYILDFLLPGLGLAIRLLIKYWGQISSALQDVYNWMVKIWNIMTKPLKGPIGAIGHFFGRVGHYASYALPPGLGGPATHATGGMVAGNQWSIVGERGPELVHLPGGSQIQPNPSISPIDWGGMGYGNQQPIVVQLVVDRKVLAQSVARANQDYASRR